MPVQYVTFSVEVTARVDCDLHREDYGVRGSPVFLEPDLATIDVCLMEIDGVEIPLDMLSKQVKDALEDRAAEAAIEQGEWE